MFHHLSEPVHHFLSLFITFQHFSRCNSSDHTGEESAATKNFAIWVSRFWWGSQCPCFSWSQLGSSSRRRVVCSCFFFCCLACLHCTVPCIIVHQYLRIAFAGFGERDIQAWAHHVQEAKIYLEFPDVFLFARNKGFALKVLVWKEGQEKNKQVIYLHN